MLQNITRVKLGDAISVNQPNLTLVTTGAPSGSSSGSTTGTPLKNTSLLKILMCNREISPARAG